MFFKSIPEGDLFSAQDSTGNTEIINGDVQVMSVR
jgi:hypothetical protein